MNNFYLSLLSLLILCVGNQKAYSNNKVTRNSVFQYEVKFDQTDLSKVKAIEQITFSFDDRPIEGSIVRSIPISNDEEINVLTVLRNGEKVPYSAQIENGTFLIAIDSLNSYLPVGSYTYNLVYESSKLNDLLDDRDGLSSRNEQNSYSIDSISASFDLLMGRISMHGKKNNNPEIKTSYSSSNSLSISNGKLEAFSEITAIVSKISTLDNTPTKKGLSWSDYLEIAFFGFDALLLLLYYLNKWKIIRKPLSCEQWVPSKSISAGAIRYLYKEYVDVKCLTTIVISLAIKKYIRIEKHNSKFNFVQIRNNEGLVGEEKFIYDRLFVNNRQSIRLDYQISSFWDDVAVCIKGYMAKLYNVKNYFKDRRLYLVESRIFSIILVLVSLVITYYLADAAVFGDALGVTFIGSVLCLSLFARNMLRGYDRFRHVILTCLIVFFGLLMVFLFFKPGLSIKLEVLLVCLIIGFNIRFTRRFKKPTPQGESIMNEMESIRRYLKYNNGNRFTQEQKEEILPYAIALDLEKEFDSLQIKCYPYNYYKPDWYSDDERGDVLSLKKLSKDLTYQFASHCSNKTLYSKMRTKINE